jgi:predicted HTH domain antitoxin
MQEAAIALSENVMLSLSMTIDEIVSAMRKEYAAKLYQEGKLTLGQAAELCGIDKYDFTVFLSYSSIPVMNYSVADFDRELAAIGVL